MNEDVAIDLILVSLLFFEFPYKTSEYHEICDFLMEFVTRRFNIVAQQVFLITDAQKLRIIYGFVSL